MRVLLVAATAAALAPPALRTTEATRYLTGVVADLAADPEEHHHHGQLTDRVKLARPSIPWLRMESG